MALSRAAGLYRLALRTQWAAVRLLSSVGAGAEPLAGEDKPGRLIDREALRRERALRPQSIRKAYVAARPSYKQVQLNEAIKVSTSVDAVLDLATARPELLNCVIVSTALCIIAKIIGNSEPALWLKQDGRFKQLMRTACSMMENDLMDAQGFSNLLYACGQLGIAPPPSWLCVYWDNNAMVLDDFSAQSLSNTMYACGQLGIVPPADWFLRYWHAAALQMATWVPQDFSNTLYACGQLGIKPPLNWMQRCWHASALKLGEFKPQEISNTIYACGQLAMTPPEYWLQHFWHASALQMTTWIAQDFSNTLYACGQLGITPPADWLQRCWHASASRLAEALPQNLCNTLYACGQLDITPPAEWLQLLDDSFERTLPDANPQHFSNTALALATLGLWTLPVWPRLWERVCRAVSRDAADWNEESRLHTQQLYQVYQAAAVERPGLLPAPDPETLAIARKGWVDTVRVHQKESSSRLHADVSACLARMGIAHANERWCERAERSIDIAVEGTSAPVAVEVDGPTHFLQDGRPNGSTRLRNRMLAAHGWRVVVADYQVWEALQTEAQQEEYLRRLLA